MAIPILRSISVGIGLVAALLCAGAAAQNAFAQGATIEATPSGSALAGSTVTVKWSGPNDRGDYITVVRKGGRPFDYLDYKTTSDGRAPVNPVLLVMPAEPGAYEIRYVRNNPREVLAAVPLEVTAVAASIEGPASVGPDARFEVAWSGPNNRGDFVTIVAVGAATRAYGSYVDARSGTPDKKTGRTVATLRAPVQPGRYELRYVQQGTHVIGTRAIDVGASSAGAAASGSAGAAASAAAGASPAGAGPASASRAGTRADAGAAAGAAGGPASGASAAAGAGPSSATGTGALAGTRAGAAASAASQPAAAGGAAAAGAGPASASTATTPASAGSGTAAGASGASAKIDTGTGAPAAGAARAPGAGAASAGNASNTNPLATATVVPFTGAIPIATAVPDLVTSLTGTDPATSTVQSWPANASVRYLAQVDNRGIASANGAVITIPRSTGLTKTSLTCVSSGGAQCPANVTVSQIESGGVAVPLFPAGGSVQFAIATNVVGAVGSQVSMTVTAAPQSGTSEANTSNNTSTRSYPIAAPVAAPTGTMEFSASGTFTVPEGVTRVVVEVWGGGGGGGTGGASYCGGIVGGSCTSGGGGTGGGSGAYTRVPLTVIAGSALEITIGASGPAGGDGAPTQVVRAGAVLASADGGKSGTTGGAGGSASTAPGGVARPGNGGASGGAKPPAYDYVNQSTGGTYGQDGGAGGAGGVGVTGTLNPLGSNGGAGGKGASYGCYVRPGSGVSCTAGPTGLPGLAGVNGYALIAW